MRTRTLIRLDWLVGLPLCMLAFLLDQPLRLLPRSRTRQVRRILVIKVLGLGSVLLATPMLRRLRQAHPGARLDFLTFSSNAELVRRLASVDDVLVIRRDRPLATLAQVPALLLRLRRARYDLVVDLEFYSRLSNLLARWTGARRRVGFFVRARWRGSLLTDPVYFNPTLPFGQAVQALLRPLGVCDDGDARLLPPAVDAEEADAAWTRLVTLGVPEHGTVVVVNVNASDLCVERRWPGDRFARLVERFPAEVARVDRFVFIGAGSETGVVREVLEQVEPGAREACLDLSGRTSLAELTVLVQRSALVVTNDSGPMHLAAALGVPTISFFGPETPALYGPVGGAHLVFYARHWCSPCLSVYNAKIALCGGENECMRRLTLDDVVARSAVFCRERVGLSPPRVPGRRAVEGSSP